VAPPTSFSRLLESELGEKVTSRDTTITFKGDAGQSLAAVRACLNQIANQGRPLLEDAMRHTDPGGANGRM
jgi:hypothetical protein